jgi:hypothetical protein
MIRGAAASLLAMAGLLLSPLRATGQCLPSRPGEEEPCPLDAPGWVGHFTSISANAFIGGMTAGVVQHLRGRPFGSGFVRGALGGGVVSAGKWVAAQRFSGAGLAGRELAAVGVSMTRNAAEGRGAFEELIFPLGPTRLYVRPGAGWSMKVDAVTTGWLIYGITERELDFDASGSLSSGTIVFRTRGKILELDDGGAHAAGLTNVGVIFAADVPAYGSAFSRRILAHERVHVVQTDQLFAWWTDYGEDWLLRRLPGGAAVAKHTDINVSTELLHLFGRLIPEHADRPWEIEAIFLAR